MTSVSDVKFGTLVLRAGGAGWLRFIVTIRKGACFFVRDKRGT